MVGPRHNLFACIALTLLLAMSAAASTVVIPAASRARWRAGSVKIAISQSLLQSEPNIKFGSDVRSAITRAISSWQSESNFRLVEVTSDRSSVSPEGIAGDGISLITIAPTAENVALFKGDIESAAKTRVFIDKRGYISEADIVLSPFLQFSTDGSYGTYDIETTVRHEIGHLLGLRHSSVVGSVMYDVASRNGVFGETAIPGGLLTEDDISAFRDLYDDSDYDNCCGSVNGKLTGMTKTSRTAGLWLEDAETGNVVSHTTSGPDGSFRFGGISFGKYKVVARESSKANDFSIVGLGDVDVADAEPVSLVQRLPVQARDFSTDLLGKNGILSDSPIRLGRGSTYSLYIGGRELRSKSVRLEADSPYISIDADSLADNAYDGGVSGIQFSLTVDAKTPSGSYSICAVSLSGARDCVPGGIVVSSR